ncbi:MAG: type II secretion system protein [bacterium]|nr:type II secretion system protein [bacterium]
MKALRGKGSTPTPERVPFRRGVKGVRARLMWGFTLIELLIVIALMVVLGAVGFTSLVDKNQRDEFDSTVKRAIITLNQARDRSATQDSLDAESASDWWGVYFYKGIETTDNGLEVCTTASYGAPNGVPSFNLLIYEGTAGVVETFVLPESVSFDVTSTFGTDPYNCTKIINFKQITGVQNLSGGATSSEVILRLTRDSSVSSTIMVYSNGLIEFTGKEESGE